MITHTNFRKRPSHQKKKKPKTQSNRLVAEISNAIALLAIAQNRQRTMSIPPSKLSQPSLVCVFRKSKNGANNRPSVTSSPLRKFDGAVPRWKSNYVKRCARCNLAALNERVMSVFFFVLCSYIIQWFFYWAFVKVRKFDKNILTVAVMGSSKWKIFLLCKLARSL